MESFVLYVYVALFGIVGVILRFVTNNLFKEAFKINIAYATFLINIIGSFCIGVVSKTEINQDVQIGIMVGLLGGFTTFSGYALDTIRLLEESTLLGYLNLILAPPLMVLSCFLGRKLSV